MRFLNAKQEHFPAGPAPILPGTKHDTMMKDQLQAPAQAVPIPAPEMTITSSSRLNFWSSSMLQHYHRP